MIFGSMSAAQLNSWEAVPARKWKKAWGIGVNQWIAGSLQA